jgi:hypothetical protein
MKRIIALLTDFGVSDNFVGVMKGVISKINPNAQFIDISHNIEPQDILGAAFMLESAFKYFPEGSIFLVVVDPGVGSKRKPIIIRTKNYFFVGPDNGVLSLAVNKDGMKEIVAIENKKYMLLPVSDTFHGRDIFAPVVAHLSKGKNSFLFGQRLRSIEQLNIPRPKINKNILKGEIIHIDRFGNLVTNMNRNLFRCFTQGKKFEIKIRNKKITTVVKSYQAVQRKQLLAIFGSFGLLEISVNGGSAEKRLKARKGMVVKITKIVSKV